METDYTRYLIELNNVIFYVKKDDGVYLHCIEVNYNANKSYSDYEHTVKILKSSKYKIYDDLSDIKSTKVEEKPVPQPWDIIKTSQRGYLRLVSNKVGDKLYVVPIQNKANKNEIVVDFNLLNNNKHLQLSVDRIYSLDINGVRKILINNPLSLYTKKRFIKELIKYNNLEKIDLSSVEFDFKKGTVIIDNDDKMLIVGAGCEDGKHISYGLYETRKKEDTILIGGVNYQINYNEKKFISDDDVKFYVTEGFEKLVIPPKPNKQKKYRIGSEVNIEGSKEKIIIIDKIQEKYIFVKSSDEGLFLGIDKSSNLKIKNLNRKLTDEELIEILLKIEKISNSLSEQDIRYLPKQTQNIIESHLVKKFN